MKKLAMCLLICVCGAATAGAQTLPRLVRFDGAVTDAQGQPRSGVVELTFALYQASTDGTPLWTETQSVELNALGRYTVLLGATQAEGLPLEFFASGEARWLGVQPAGEAEQPRVMFVSVAYALKAADADTIGGRPASAFVLADTAASGASASSNAVVGGATGTMWNVFPLVTYNEGLIVNHGWGEGLKLFGYSNHFAMADAAETDTWSNYWYLYRTGADGKLRFNRGDSDRVTFDGTGNVGIGTNAPQAMLHLQGWSNHLAFADTAEANTWSNYWYVYRTGGDGVLRFYRGSMDRLRLDASGTTPILKINGALNTNGQGAALRWIENFSSDYGMDAFYDGGIDALIFRGIQAGAVGSGENNLLVVRRWPASNRGVGIGTDTPLDALHVAADIRVGTGTTGCVKDADATLIAGTCASDRRLKKDITPFAPTLEKLSQLQPVHFSWRADEYPDRHFGAARSFGLIAQDVEPLFPELVTTDAQGYKAVRYNELPFLMLQAAKELKAENDLLKQQLDLLKQQQAGQEERLRALEARVPR